MSSSTAGKSLWRLLFTLFADDVGLLPETSFEKHLEQTAEIPQGFATLWQDMAQGSDFYSSWTWDASITG